MVENHAIKKAQLIHSNSEEGSAKNGTKKGWKSEENYKEWERENGKITMIEKNKCNKNCFYNSTMFLITFLLLDCYMKASWKAFPENCLIFWGIRRRMLLNLTFFCW